MKNKALSFILIVSLALILTPQSALAADHSVSSSTELEAALGSAIDGDTIRLTADIDYYKGIAISRKTITFDLNGYELNVTNNAGDGLNVDGGVVNLIGAGAFNVSSSAGDGLKVDDGSVVNLIGAGAFNVSSSADFCYGVNANNGSRATVSNATATGNCIGAHAAGSGSFVRVTNNVISAHGSGAVARNGGTLSIGGNVQGVVGADAVGNNSLLEVGGNVTGQSGVACAMGANLSVAGNVTATGGGIDPRAITITFGGTISVGGNVTASGTDTVGAFVYDGGTIIVDGWMIAPVLYVEVGGVEKKIVMGEPGTPPFEGYLVFTEGSNIVRVGKVASAVVNPANLSFNKEMSLQDDASTQITWNNASSVTNVKAGGSSIGSENYSVSGNTLMIKKDYLARQALGSLELSVEYDIGAASSLAIDISDSTPALITGLPDTYSLFTGGRVTWTPSPENGTWSWDHSYFSATAQNVKTFTALKEGVSTITYSVGGTSHKIIVTIYPSLMPSTGQDGSIVWILCLLSVLFGFLALFMAKERKKGEE